MIELQEIIESDLELEEKELLLQQLWDTTAQEEYSQDE